jgi:FKBP12-rapamycin complex-associated protein
MASTSQSLRFLVGPATTASGGGSFDALNRILADLCTRGNPKVSLNLSLISAKLIVA